MIELRHDSALATSAELLLPGDETEPFEGYPNTPDGRLDVADTARAADAAAAIGAFSNLVLSILCFGGVELLLLWLTTADRDLLTPPSGEFDDECGDGEC